MRDVDCSTHLYAMRSYGSGVSQQAAGRRKVLKMRPNHGTGIMAVEAKSQDLYSGANVRSCRRPSFDVLAEAPAEESGGGGKRFDNERESQRSPMAFSSAVLHKNVVGKFGPAVDRLLPDQIQARMNATEPSNLEAGHM